jgi:hypothetical protein
MHGMLKRAAASAIPALIGLAVSPASTMAAPQTGQAVAGPVTGGREVHGHLAQLPRSGMSQGRLAGTTGTTETTADTRRRNGTDAEFAATPAIPVINGDIARLAHFSRAPGSANGAPAIGIIATGKDDKFIGNHITGSGGSGNTIYRNVTGSETGSVGSNGSTGGGNTIYRNVSGP